MVVTRRPGHKNELVNRKFTELFGYTIEDVPDEEHWWPLAYPNKAYREAIKAEWRRRVERASIEEGDIDPMEASVRCKDGSHRHIEFHFARSGDSHLVSFVDLTDRLRAEIQLRESEERFRLVANEAPVLIWMCGPDRLCNYFNKPWPEFTGRAVQAELGDGWVEGVHPDDLNRCLQIYIEAFDRREPFEMQYRLRRHDGEYRWILDKGVPRFNPDGTFAGYIGSCIDITDRKLAEEAMSTIGRRLIEAQEEERAWIGRELHDDINQRLALLAVELDRWSQHIPSTPELSGQIRHTQQRIMQISKDVQGLSHRLHSSKLEYLGLATAANSFCKELAGQSKVDVQFSHAGIPRSVPKEVSLCLFRVLQEALQNAVKHSGVRSFAVDHHGTEEAIELTVSDIGRGFEEQDAFTREGLGLISMRERVQLVHGELSVKSKTGAGTTIHARVPLITHEYRAVAG
jgi:PAS domain S-box-containing protein